MRFADIPFRLVFDDNRGSGIEAPVTGMPVPGIPVAMVPAALMPIYVTMVVAPMRFGFLRQR